MKHVARNPQFNSITYEDIGAFTVGVRSHVNKMNNQIIVLIHGIGVSSAYFVPLARELAKTYTVIALDLPGYGKATKPPAPLSIEELASVMYSFLKKHNISHSVLIGHSMGCQIIAQVSKKHPELFAKMILLAPTTNKKERSVLKQGLRLLQDTFLESPKVNLVIFSDYVRMGVARYLQTSRWMVDDRIEETLSENQTPALIIRGSKDHIVPYDWALYLKEINRHHSLAQVEGAPHAFHYSYAKQTGEICKNYIEE